MGERHATVVFTRQHRNSDKIERGGLRFHGAAQGVTFSLCSDEFQE